MTTGVAAPGLIVFTTSAPEFDNAEVLRAAPDGVFDLNGDTETALDEALRTAYPYLWRPAERGVFIPSFFDDYYFRIHVFPNPLDFGYISSPTAREFQVWNAYLTPQLLGSVTETGTSGLTLSGGPTENYSMLALESLTYTVTAAQNGPGITDATYSFDFPAVDIYALRVFGTRVIIFPFDPNWVSPVLERFEWFTAVTEMRDGSEQRSRMRQNPRKTIEYDFLLHHGYQNLLDSLLFGWQGRAWGLPLWMNGQRLQTTVLAGDTTVTCDTDGYDFQVNGSIIFYANPGNYEVVTISSISATGLTLSTKVLNSWRAGTLIFPVMIAFLEDAPKMKRITSEVTDGTVQFKSQDYLLGGGDWTASYLGYPVLELEAQRQEYITESWNRRTNVIDYAVGQFKVFDKDSFSRAVRSGKYWGIDRARIFDLRKILNHAQGKWKAFWAPTFDNDMRIVENVFDNDSTLMIKRIDYALRVQQNPLRRYIRVQLKNGTIHYRKIVGTDDVNVPAGTEVLTVDAVFTTGFTVNDVFLISFMPLCRLDSDAVELEWITMSVANTALALRPVKDDV